MYACHTYESRHPARYMDYTMTLIGDYRLDGPLGCKTGVRVYRNLAHWAKMQRDYVIERLNATELVSSDDSACDLIRVFLDSQKTHVTQPKTHSVVSISAKSGPWRPRFK